MLTLSCPSCNTAFALPAVPPDRRAECPRCHDVFPVRGQESESPLVAPAVPFQSPVSNPQPPTRRRLALAAGVLAVAAVFVLTRGKKPEENRGPLRPAHVATPAAELHGLAYLPADTNVVFAAQPGPFAAYAKRTGQDAGELVAKAGLPRPILNVVADLGLTLEQIDHVAGGTTIGDGDFNPRLTLVLVLREPPADEDDFLKRLKAKKQAGGKPRFDATLFGLPMTAARVSATVWVFGLALGSDPAKNLAAVDRGYEPGGKQLPAALAEAIATRVPPDAAAWLATDDANWAEKGGVKLVVGQVVKRPEWLPVLARGRAAVAAIGVGDEPRLRLFVKAADDAAGRRARDFFKALDPKATVGGEGTAAQYDAPMDPATAYATLQQFFAAGKE